MAICYFTQGDPGTDGEKGEEGPTGEKVRTKLWTPHNSSCENLG